MSVSSVEKSVQFDRLISCSTDDVRVLYSNVARPSSGGTDLLSQIQSHRSSAVQSKSTNQRRFRVECALLCTTGSPRDERRQLHTMASTKPTLTPLLPTKPILNKTGALLSPQTTLPSPSPHFQHPASATKAVTSYFAVASPSTMPTTPSILLKPKVLPEAVVSPLEGAATAGLGLSAPGSSDGDEAVVEEQGPRGRLVTATSSGASTPHSAIVSPQRPTAAADAAAVLQPPTDAGLVDGRTGGPGSGRASRSPSPHCHFAPLPKVELGRPGTRRNSFALGVATRNKIIGGEYERTPSRPWS